MNSIDQLWQKLKWSLAETQAQACLFCKMPVAQTSTSDVCPTCLDKNRFTPVLKPLVHNNHYKAFATYKFTQPIKQLIYGSKFYQHSQNNLTLAQLFLGEFQHYYLPLIRPQNTLMISIPEHSQKENPSGHLKSIFKPVAAQLGCQFSDKILSWNKTVCQQHTLPNKQQRMDNMQEAFKIDSTNQIEQSHLLVVDDILTTGATMNEALKTLSQRYPDKTINGVALSFVHLGEEK